MSRPHRTICVYCASSRRVDRDYFDAAAELGERLARDGRRIVYGGGSIGLMGTLADAALAAGGEVVGVIPEFLQELELGHVGLTEMHVVPDMHARKQRMISLSDAFVALPGGCGTFEELFEAITWKRLGLHTGPIVLADVSGYFRPCLELLNQCVDHGFMDARHATMWTSVSEVADVLPAIDGDTGWSQDAIAFASP
jgi:uncharacterized protein (TIGR00730 family)